MTLNTKEGIATGFECLATATIPDSPGRASCNVQGRATPVSLTGQLIA